MTLYCTKDHQQSRMNTLPLNPFAPITHHECKQCHRTLTIEQIIDAFIEIEIDLEQDLHISILFYAGFEDWYNKGQYVLYSPQLIIESEEFLGETRRDAQRKQISPDLIAEIKLLFQEKIEARLEIYLTQLRDLWQ